MLTKRLEETIGLLLVEAARLLRLQIDRALDGAGLGLTSGEARTLAYVARSPASRQTALAAQMNVEPMTLVTFLDKLESRGLVALGKRLSGDPSLAPPA
jgi:MarR family transcriptional regulator, transcriptional regulator for hemolysin